MDDKELKAMLNTIIEEIGRTDERLTARLDTMQSSIQKLQSDVNILKARNDSFDLFALYNQLDRRISEIEKKIS